MATRDGQPPPLAPSPPAASVAAAAAPLVGVALLFVVWEVWVRVADVRRVILPPPSDVVRHVLGEPGFYAEHALVTVGEATVGIVAAFLVACLIAALMAHSRFLERATFPLIVLVQCTPVAALAPVFLLWFGFSSTPKVLTAGLFAFVPFVTNAFTGFRSVDRDTLEVLRSVDASTLEVFWRLRVPHALPYLFSAGRICLGLALVGAVVGELYGGSSAGLGFQVAVAQRRGLYDQLWGSIFVLAAIGVIGTVALALLERRVLRWHSSQRDAA